MRKLLKASQFLPTASGVYLFINKQKKPIYIGKASNIRKRVLSYFSERDIKSSLILKHSRDIQTFITSNEIEALLLEDILIKKHKPTYNIRLKDDKKYPYIKVTTGEEYPRVFYTRDINKKDGAYFGPYTNVKQVKRTLRIIQKIFPLRTCKGKLPKKECLDYYLKRCSGPCIGAIKKDEYNQIVKGVLKFLSGDTEEVEKDIEIAMKRASDEEKFEKAAILRDQMLSLRSITQKQEVVLSDEKHRDIIGIYKEGRKSVIELFQIRKGKLFGKEHYILTGVGSEDEVISSFISHHYSGLYFIPSEIITQSIPYDREMLEKYLSKMAKHRVKIKKFHSETEKRLEVLAKRNAKFYFRNESLKVKRFIPLSLIRLKEALHLEKIPKRIEGIDISHIQGKESVGSCVVFIQGKPKRSEYRKFKIKSIKGINDPEMIAEVVSRRLKRILNEKREHPDLLLIDGGKGQRNYAEAVLKNLLKDKYKTLPVFSLAKRQEELHTPDGKVISLPITSPALKLLQRIRNESHRFAITYHRKLRRKNIKKSKLYNIPYIGRIATLNLLRYFGSEQQVERASIYDLMKVKGIGGKKANEIYFYFHPE